MRVSEHPYIFVYAAIQNIFALNFLEHSLFFVVVYSVSRMFPPMQMIVRSV